jgi:hypothetical protein
MPEDVEDDDELMLHFNDLNWDFRANSSTRSIYLDDVQPNRRQSMIATHMDAVTEVTMDSEFQMSPWHIHNTNADVFSPKGEHHEWVCFPLHVASHIQVVRRLCFIRDSPYPEVRAAVPNTDDPTMVVNTFRV